MTHLDQMYMCCLNDRMVLLIQYYSIRNEKAFKIKW